jgi:hypothetical protein
LARLQQGEFGATRYAEQVIRTTRIGLVSAPVSAAGVNLQQIETVPFLAA